MMGRKRISISTSGRNLKHRRFYFHKSLFQQETPHRLPKTTSTIQHISRFQVHSSIQISLTKSELNIINTMPFVACLSNSFGKQLELGFRTYFKALGFVFSNGSSWAFLFPIALNILLFWGGYSFANSITADFQHWAIRKLSIVLGNFSFSEYLPNLVELVIWVLLKILFFFLFSFYGGYVTLMLLSPLFSYISERTEEIVSGKKYPFDLWQFLRDILRGMFIALRNLFLETAWMILLFLLGFVPVIGWMGVIPLFIISAYFYGFSFIDYTSERRKKSIGQSVSFVREHKGFAISNGVMFCLFLLIPFIGVLLSGTAAIISVVAATLAVNEIDPVKG